jgi:hypothetical protein
MNSSDNDPSGAIAALDAHAAALRLQSSAFIVASIPLELDESRSLDKKFLMIFHLRLQAASSSNILSSPNFFLIDAVVDGTNRIVERCAFPSQCALWAFCPATPRGWTYPENKR